MLVPKYQHVLFSSQGQLVLYLVFSSGLLVGLSLSSIYLLTYLSAYLYIICHLSIIINHIYQSVICIYLSLSINLPSVSICRYLIWLLEGLFQASLSCTVKYFHFTSLVVTCFTFVCYKLYNTMLHLL